MHGGDACWTVNVWPAIVSVAILTSPALTPTANDTVPLPVPAAPEVTANHAGALDTAVHGHAALLAVTSTLPTPPSAPSSAPLAVRAKVHGAPCW